MKMEDGVQVEQNMKSLMNHSKMTIEKKKILSYIKNKKV